MGSWRAVASASCFAYASGRPDLWTFWAATVSGMFSQSLKDLRAFLARLAETRLTPAERAERAERAEKARAALEEWNGYAPTPAEQDGLDSELDRRLARVTSR